MVYHGGAGPIDFLFPATACRVCYTMGIVHHLSHGVSLVITIICMRQFWACYLSVIGSHYIISTYLRASNHHVYTKNFTLFILRGSLYVCFSFTSYIQGNLELMLK